MLKSSHLCPEIDHDLIEQLNSFYQDKAIEIDKGSISTLFCLKQLASAGLLIAPDNTHKDLGKNRFTAGLIELLARMCMSSAFSLWAHSMVIRYLLASKNDYLVKTFLPCLTTATKGGCSGMASAFQELAGLSDLGVVFQEKSNSIVLNGKIRWASNLFPEGFIIILPARSQKNPREKLITLITSETKRLHISPFVNLMALNGTYSSSITLENVEIPKEHILTKNYYEFLSTIRPPFLLFQTAFCVGLCWASISTSTQLMKSNNNKVFEQDFLEITTAYNEVVNKTTRLIDLSETVSEIQKKDLLSLRLQAAVVAQKATTLEQKLVGGASYLFDSHTARRIRESLFLPVQSPTEGHLRWELAC